jgi:hypothetical protein
MAEESNTGAAVVAIILAGLLILWGILEIMFVTSSWTEQKVRAEIEQEMSQPYDIQDLEAQVGKAPTNKNPERPPVPVVSMGAWTPTMELRVFVKSNKKHTIQQKWTAGAQQNEWRDLPIVYEK